MSQAILSKPKNQLLTALPLEEYQRLVPHLHLVELSLRQVLYVTGDSIEYVYFPNQSLISLVTVMGDGATVETGVVGREGMVGVEVFLGNTIASTDAIVQGKDSALRMSATVLKAEFARGGMLQKLLLRYMQALFVLVSQSAACYRRHTTGERLARWLLMVSDRVESNELGLTQDFIAQMLGTRRAGVTIAAGELQKAGLIDYHRGKIVILDRARLEAVSCECYQLIKTASSMF
jgi:CRP-like cAMP-binding protein